jgi:hypothetical protein
MRFYLQTGHGMMELNREFVNICSNSESIGVVIWPRTLTRKQVEIHATELLNAGAQVLFDPCFYVPDTVRETILDYPYWDGIDFDTLDFAGQEGREFCTKVVEYQINTLNVSEVLLPGRFTNVRNDQWLEMHRSFAEASEEMNVGKPVYSTIAIGPDILLDKPSIDAITNEVVSYPVNGIYLLYRPPGDDYFTCNSQFVLNLLSTVLSLTLAGKRVLVGYSNQQDLMLAAAGADGIASGNYRNVRRFNPDIFEEQQETEQRRSIWYYDANSLCEFQPQRLGVAYQNFNLRGRFGPTCNFCEALLGATNPGNVPWREPDAFRHFLWELRRQWMHFNQFPAPERLRKVVDMLSDCKTVIGALQATKFPLGDRSAAVAIDCFLQALQDFQALEFDRLQEL